MHYKFLTFFFFTNTCELAIENIERIKQLLWQIIICRKNVRNSRSLILLTAHLPTEEFFLDKFSDNCNLSSRMVN